MTHPLSVWCGSWDRTAPSRAFETNLSACIGNSKTAEAMAASMAVLPLHSSRSITQLRSCYHRNSCTHRRPLRAPVNHVPHTPCASSAVVAVVAQPDPRHHSSSIQRLCKSVLVGVAAAAAWSVLASAFGPSSGPFASLTLSASAPGASGIHDI